MNKLIVTPDSDPIARYSIVTLNGIDVTANCFLADEKKGVVGLFKRNQEGKRYLDGDKGVAKEIKNGTVVISLRDDAPDWIKEHYRVIRGEE